MGNAWMDKRNLSFKDVRWSAKFGCKTRKWKWKWKWEIFSTTIH